MDSIFSSDPTEPGQQPPANLVQLVSRSFPALSKMLGEVQLALATKEEQDAKLQAVMQQVQAAQELAQTAQARLAQVKSEAQAKAASYAAELDSAQQRISELASGPSAGSETLEAERAAMRETVANAYAQLAAERVARLAQPAIPVQAPVLPDKVEFEPYRGIDGLLHRVTLKAAGFDNVVVDIVRGGDNRIVHLKTGASA